MSHLMHYKHKDFLANPTDSAYASFTDNIGLDDALGELSPILKAGI